VTAPELVDALDELRLKPTWFVLDLRKLASFMDSTGLRASSASAGMVSGPTA